MLFIFEFFVVAFLIMFIYVGTGLVILAYFGLAPMPVWMQKYASHQPTKKEVTLIAIDYMATSPVKLAINRKGTKTTSAGKWFLVTFVTPAMAALPLVAMVFVTNQVEEGRATFSNANNFSFMRKAL